VHKLVGVRCFRFLGDTSPFAFFVAEPGDFSLEFFSAENAFCLHTAFSKPFSRMPDTVPSKMSRTYNAGQLSRV